jgi:hypothetical protein
MSRRGHVVGANQSSPENPITAYEMFQNWLQRKKGPGNVSKQENKSGKKKQGGGEGGAGNASELGLRWHIPCWQCPCPEQLLRQASLSRQVGPPNPG